MSKIMCAIASSAAACAVLGALAAGSAPVGANASQHLLGHRPATAAVLADGATATTTTTTTPAAAASPDSNGWW